MEKSDKIINLPKKILDYKKYFQKNIFDEDFLDEKDKALSPVLLSDKIHKETIKKTKKKKSNKKTNLKCNEKKDVEYGSNIVYIGLKVGENDGDDEFQSILNEQMFKIILDEKIFRKKTPNNRKTGKNYKFL